MLLAFLLLFAAQAEEIRLYGQAFTLAAAEKSWSQAFTPGYQKQHNLEVTPEEFAATRAKFPPNAREGRAGEYFIRLIADNFKVQRAIFRKHGGRVALSAFGTHIAIDGTVAEMKLLEKSGQLSFSSPQLRESFYQKLLNTRGDGVAQGKNAVEAFARAPWDPQPQP